MSIHIISQFQTTNHLTRPSGKRNQPVGITFEEKINIWNKTLGENPTIKTLEQGPIKIYQSSIQWLYSYYMEKMSTYCRSLDAQGKEKPGKRSCDQLKSPTTTWACFL